MRSSSIEVLKTDPETIIQKARRGARACRAIWGALNGARHAPQIQERFRLEVDDAKAEEVRVLAMCALGVGVAAFFS
jgi:hypothetical protein